MKGGGPPASRPATASLHGTEVAAGHTTHAQGCVSCVTSTSIRHRPSKQRRFHDIRSSLASSASLLHGRAERRHCSPVHPVSPAGNPVQTHTKAPSGPLRTSEPVSLCILNEIHRLYTRSKAMLHSYVSAEFVTDRWIRRRDIGSQIGRRSTIPSKLVSSPRPAAGQESAAPRWGDSKTVGCSWIERPTFNVAGADGGNPRRGRMDQSARGVGLSSSTCRRHNLSTASSATTSTHHQRTALLLIGTPEPVLSFLIEARVLL